MSMVRYVLDMSSAHCAPYESATCRSNRQKSRSSCTRRRWRVRELRRIARRIAPNCARLHDAAGGDCAVEVLREEGTSPRGEGAGVRAAENDPRGGARDAGGCTRAAPGLRRGARRGRAAWAGRRTAEPLAIKALERDGVEERLARAEEGEVVRRDLVERLALAVVPVLERDDERAELARELLDEARRRPVQRRLAAEVEEDGRLRLRARRPVRLVLVVPLVEGAAVGRREVVELLRHVRARVEAELAGGGALLHGHPERGLQRRRRRSQADEGGGEVVAHGDAGLRREGRRDSSSLAFR